MGIGQWMDGFAHWSLSFSSFLSPVFSHPLPIIEMITAKFNVEESLYACAVAHYSLGQYTEAREMIDRLLRSNPDHRYANELHAYIKDAQGR